MKKNKIKLEHLALLLLVGLGLVTGGAGGLLIRPADEPDQVLKTRFGDVAWPHGLHVRHPDISCQGCHHTDKQGTADPARCSECHEKKSMQEFKVLDYSNVGDDSAMPADGGTPDNMQAFHAKCQGCHNAMVEGPVQCRDCHSQTFTGSFGMVAWDHREHSRKMDALECVSCHHKDYQAKSNAEYRACSVCHKPVAAMDVDMRTDLAEHESEMHGECSYCHSETNPEVGARFCKTCHVNMDRDAGLKPALRSPAQEKVPPSIEQAVHSRCLECHNTNYQDLSEDMPAECTECHKPARSLAEGGEAGPTIWSHTRHSEFVPWSCSDCHHTDKEGEPQLACYRCHGEENFEDIPRMEYAMHTNCTECHMEKLEGPGPDDCNRCHSENRDQLVLFSGKSEEGEVWWNHAFHAVDMAFSCEECHHNTIKKDGKYFTVCEPGKPCPDTAGDVQPCSNCHVRENANPWNVLVRGAPKLGDAVHGSCITCHDSFEAGPLECKECHFK